MPVRVLWVLNKKPRRVESPLWRVPCNLTRTDGELDAALEGEGTAGVVGGSLAPAGKGAT